MGDTVPDSAPETPAPTTNQNMTRAGVTGKVPVVEVRGRRSRARKPVKLERHQRKHVQQLKMSGQISQSAAKQNGLVKP